VKVVWGKVVETRKFTNERRSAGTNLTVSLFTNNKLGDAFIWAFFVIVLVP